MKFLTTVKSIKNYLLTCVYGALLLFNPVFGQSDSTQTETVANDSIHYVKPILSLPNVNCVTAPEGFVKSKAFNGYMHYQTSSTILIQYIENATYLQIDQGANEEFFQSNNLTLVTRESFQTNDGVSGVWYKCSFHLNDNDYIRYIVYMGDLNNTLWLNITYPLMVEGMVEELLKTSIETAQFKLAKNEE